jgi:hypothetical protein
MPTLSRIMRRAALFIPVSVLLFTAAPRIEAQAGPALRDPDYRALAELVAATAFPNFGNSTEGTVIARVKSLRGGGKPFEVWVHEKGTLRKGSDKDLDRAFGANRRNWPPYTILFAVSNGADGKLRLEVHTRYDMGLSPESRGGMEEVWQVGSRPAAGSCSTRRSPCTSIDGFASRFNPPASCPGGRGRPLHGHRPGGGSGRGLQPVSPRPL